MAQNNQLINTLETWCQFALQQVAAESFWNLQGQATAADILQRGNSPINPDDPNQPPDQYVRLTPQ